MPFRTERKIWTYLIVTAVTAVIWFLAASETRDRRPFNATVHFQVADAASQWIVTIVPPGTPTLRIVVEGSNLALDRAQEVAQRGITVELPPVRGQERISLIELVRRNPELAAAGVTVASVDPTFLIVDRDEIISVPARVRASLPGVQTEGEVTIDPPEVTVSMPSAVRDRAVGEITVEAFLDRTQLDRLPPDVRHEQEAKVRLSEALAGLGGIAGGASNITISPGSVKLGLTVRSRTEQATLDLVRVHLSGPPEDNKEYIVEFEDEVFRNVTITGESDLIRRIMADEVRVFAILYVASHEKEQRITRKRISHFIAHVPDGEGGSRGVLIDGRVNDSALLPEIRLNIERKETP